MSLFYYITHVYSHTNLNIFTILHKYHHENNYNIASITHEYSSISLCFLLIYYFFTPFYISNDYKIII